VTSDRTLDLSPLRPLSAACRQLAEDGWRVADGVGSFGLATSTADPRGAVDALAPLSGVAVNVEAVGARDGATLLLRLVNSRLAVVDAPSDDVHELFDVPADQQNARAAFEGDAEAALSLPMEWEVRGTFDLARALDAPTGTRVGVAAFAETVTRYVAETTAVSAARLAESGSTRVLVALDAAGIAVLGCLVLAGHEDGPVSAPLPLSCLLPGEAATADDGPAPGLLVPAEDSAPPPVWLAAAAHVRALAAQLVWRSLATDATAQDERLVLTFHGYKKASFGLPHASAWTPQQVSDTLALRAWALHDASPDRLLAVRQVVSLYDGDDALRHAADVRASAEIVYVGLRTDAVAEAVKSAREAHVQAQDDARQAVKSAHDLVKAATERMLAALIAVGAVLVANAGRTLPNAPSRQILLLVAAFLAVLAVASVALEGPLMALPAKNLKEDLQHSPGLLTETQRRHVDQTPSLEAARGRVRLVRVAVPMAHLTFALLLVVFGYPSRYTP